jgi:hypothetical protein
LGVEYAKNANVHGYKRGEYFGKDGWNMNSSQTTAAFLGSLTGVYTIHCLVLDKNNNPTGQEASYRQVILPSDDYQALKNIREYKKEIDKSFNTISPKTALAINAVAINEETTETLSLNLFIGKSKKNPGNYVLTDLTPGVQHQRTYEGNNLKDLFEEFDSKNTYPDGILAYEIPSNTLGYPTLKGNFTTDGASFWESLSTGAGWASLGLAVAGLVATFTPAAPIAPYLFIAAGATGATSGTASIIDKVQKGTLTNETLALDVIMIASSFLGMAGSLSSIAKASSIIKISSTGMQYIILTDFALNGTAAVMITADGLESIQDIHDNKNLTTAEKIDAIVKILGQLTLTAGLLVLSSKNLKGGELEKLPKVKRQTSKKPYNPEQNSEFIDTPENLTGGKSPKLTIFKPKSKTSVKNVLAERDAFWKELKEKYFPENDWSKTDFVTEGVDFNKFKSDHPNLFDEMAAKYDSMAAADRFLPGLIESGSSIPFKVTFNKGDELFKIVPKGGNIDGPSPYYLTKSELDFVKQHPERLEQVLGLPLSSTTSEYDVFKIVAKKDNISGFESIIAQTKQSAKSNPGDFYETTGGKKQTLIIDNMESGTWEKIAVPVEAISPKSLPKID